MEKKVILSTLAGFVTMFLSGWVLFGMILKGQMEKWQTAIGDCGNMEPAFAPMIIAQLALSLLLAILIIRLGKMNFKSGLITAAWVNLLVVIWYDAWMWASFPFMTMELSLYDVIGNVVVGALAGGVIGWVASRIN